MTRGINPNSKPPTEQEREQFTNNPDKEPQSIQEMRERFGIEDEDKALFARAMAQAAESQTDGHNDSSKPPTEQEREQFTNNPDKEPESIQKMRGRLGIVDDDKRLFARAMAMAMAAQAEAEGQTHEPDRDDPTEETDEQSRRRN